MEERWDQIIGGEARGPGASLARLGLAAAAGLYAAGLAANHWVYDAGLRARTRPPVPVISLGNISLGGTGKTTSAAFLAGLLASRARVGIVLRGYRRRSGPEALVVSDGHRLLAGVEQAGDEALMLARRLPACAVAVGKRRERVIQALVEQAGVQVAILDDGFQYFRMARDLDIVLLDAMADDRALRLFPAGRLREPWSSLRRASQVWITHADLAPAERVADLVGRARELCGPDRVVVTRHRPGALSLLSGQAPPTSLSGQRVVALSALGNPQSFERSVQELGAQVTPARFPDHHPYAPGDYDRVGRIARQAGAAFIVTTGKDAVKLPPAPADLPPVVVLECELEILQGRQAVDDALDALVESGALR